MPRTNRTLLPLLAYNKTFESISLATSEPSNTPDDPVSVIYFQNFVLMQTYFRNVQPPNSLFVQMAGCAWCCVVFCVFLKLETYIFLWLQGVAVFAH
mmetsp:Transcript_37233/g.62025  ORF Transcript_37233/g.62025 Transcript_37233/m.62025 type:complete len:97 (-) Transcript_37233:1178-1468(-)